MAESAVLRILSNDVPTTLSCSEYRGVRPLDGGYSRDDSHSFKMTLSGQSGPDMWDVSIRINTPLNDPKLLSEFERSRAPLPVSTVKITCELSMIAEYKRNTHSIVGTTGPDDNPTLPSLPPPSTGTLSCSFESEWTVCLLLSLFMKHHPESSKITRYVQDYLASHQEFMPSCVSFHVIAASTVYKKDVIVRFVEHRVDSPYNTYYDAMECYTDFLVVLLYVYKRKFKYFEDSKFSPGDDNLSIASHKFGIFASYTWYFKNFISKLITKMEESDGR